MPAAYNPASNFIPTGTASDFAVRFPVPGGPPWLSIAPASGTIAIGSSAGATLRFTTASLPTGTYNGSLPLTTNDPDEATLTVPVTLTVSTATPHAAWQTSAFPTGTPAAQTAASFDFDGDGLNNLLEYGLGTNPTAPSATPAPAFNNSDRLQLQFTRPTGRSDITTCGEHSTDLSTWHTAANLVETVITDLGNRTEPVTVREAGTVP